MSPRTRLLRPAIAAMALAAAPLAAHGAGNHYGWCNGVGNPHGGTDCGGSAPILGTTGTVTPAQPPVSNQLPPTGTTGPTPTGIPTNVIVITPNAPNTITGTSPVPTVVLQPDPPQGFTGTGTLPVIIQPNAPTTIVGYGPVPTITGTPGPSFTGTGMVPVVVQPLPPTTTVGYAPVPQIVPLPQPGFTGTGVPPVNVTPNPPTTFTGYGPVPPTIIIQPNPPISFTGPQLIPPVPQGTPGLVPTAIPPQVPQAQPILVPRPRPTGGGTRGPSPGATTAGGGTITHAPQPAKPALGPTHVTIAPGRQPAHAEARFAASDGGGDWNCLASGHGRRANGSPDEVAGIFTHAGAVDSLARDVPARHPKHTHCMITVRRK